MAWWEDFREDFDIIGRRFRGLAMISRGIVPKLIVSQRVVDRITEAARRYIADETGETMVGLVLTPASHARDDDAMPTLLVLDTIAPDESSIRRSHMFEQGDDMQGDIFVWLLENWDAYQTLGRDMQGKPLQPEWKTALRHLGDWHKQPGFMIQPSGGDLMTALRFMEDDENALDFLLVPIVTLGHDSVTHEHEGAQVNYFNVPLRDGTSLRMDWWYIQRDSRFFQPITPQIIPAKDLPSLTPYPWHILYRDLLDDEVSLLEDNQYFLLGNTTILWEVDGDLPLEICFIVGRRGTTQVWLVVTNWDYPKSMPRARTAQFTGIDATMYIYDVFAALWKNSTPASVPDSFSWSDERFIVDLLNALEGRERAKPAPKAPAVAAQPVQPKPSATRIPVQIDVSDALGASAALASTDKPSDDSNDKPSGNSSDKPSDDSSDKPKKETA
jgi:hypothetical protein